MFTLRNPIHAGMHGVPADPFERFNLETFKFERVNFKQCDLLVSCYYLSCNSYFTIMHLASPTQMWFNRTQITRAAVFAWVWLVAGANLL